MVKIISKRLQLNRAQSRLIMIVTIGVVITIFCLVSAKTLWSQAAFQRQIISGQRQAAKQLEGSVQAANQLVNHYNTIFDNANNPTNVLGGRNTDSLSARPP